MKADPEVERSLEALFAAPPEAFVAERTRLATALKQAGNRDGAAAVAKTQKPTLSAWATNQLARREADEVRRLAEASTELREAQLGMIGGGGDARAAFAAAATAQREALARLRAVAERILADGKHAVTPAVIERITQNLRAMITGEEAAREIQAGRLVRDLAADGFADFATLAAAVPGGPRHAGGPRPAAKPAAAPASPAEAKRAAKREADERAREARAAADRTREIARLRQAAEQAAARARKADDAARRARAAADDADADAKRARADADDARRRLEEAQRR